MRSGVRGSTYLCLNVVIFGDLLFALCALLQSLLSGILSLGYGPVGPRLCSTRCRVASTFVGNSTFLALFTSFSQRKKKGSLNSSKFQEEVKVDFKEKCRVCRAQ